MNVETLNIFANNIAHNDVLELDSDLWYFSVIVVEYLNPTFQNFIITMFVEHFNDCMKSIKSNNVGITTSSDIKPVVVWHNRISKWNRCRKSILVAKAIWHLVLIVQNQRVRCSSQCAQTNVVQGFWPIQYSTQLNIKRYKTILKGRSQFINHLLFQLI